MSQHAYPIQTIKLRTATDADDFREALRPRRSGDPAGKDHAQGGRGAAFLAYGPQAGRAIASGARGWTPSGRQPLSGGGHRR